MFVYKITNIVNNKAYVGITIRTLENRWIRHISAAKRGIGGPLQRAIRKYGTTSFTMELLETVTTIDELRVAEKKWIQCCNTFGGNGYNATLGGEGTWGRIHSVATRDRIKVGQQLARVAGTFLGTTHLTNIRLARRAQLGVPLSTEHRANISNSSKGKPRPHMAGKTLVPVDQYTKDGIFVATYHSYTAAARSIGSDATSVMRVCQGKHHTVRGFVFKLHKPLQ